MKLEFTTRDFYNAGGTNTVSLGEPVTKGKFFPVTNEGLELITYAQKCYSSLHDFRKMVERNRKYYRGNQWGDVVEINGEKMTEEEYIEKQGKPALRNNLIRPQVKNALGQFRNSPSKSTVVASNREGQQEAEMMSVALEACYNANNGKERDVRLLEKDLCDAFGCYITGYGYDTRRRKSIPYFREVDIMRFFVDNYEDICGEDVAFIGDYMDVTKQKLLETFADTTAKEKELLEIYSSVSQQQYLGLQKKTEPKTEVGDIRLSTEFNKCRIIRVCRLEGMWKLYCHDYMDGSYEIHDLKDLAEIEAVNAARIQMAMDNGITDVPLIEIEKKYCNIWMYYCLSPYGHVLSKVENPYQHNTHPYVFKFYPDMGGQSWSFVNDMIDTQKMINRMIILNDFILSSSAKGVLLVPEDAIPDDMDIEDFAEEWTKYNGVIKIKRGAKEIPQQIVSKAINVGQTEMLNLHIKLLQDIGGMNDAIMGRNANAGTPAQLYQQQTQNSQLNILDYIESFSWILKERDYRIIQLIAQYDTEDHYNQVPGNNYTEAAKHWKPEMIRNIDFDNFISRSVDTPAYRMYIDSLLADLFGRQLIPLEMFLENSSLPFADKLLQSIRSMQQQNGGITAQQAQQLGQQAGVNPEQAAALQQQLGLTNNAA